MNRARIKFAFSAVFVWVFSLLIFTSVLAEKENDPDKAKAKSLVNAYEQGVKLTAEEQAFIQDYIDNKLVKSKKTFSFYSPTATVALEEHFTAGALPAGWQNVDNVGNGEVWEFNNPGARTINTTTSADGFAIFDSDNYGNNGLAENADLITPPIDCSALAQVYLNFEHYFQSGFGGAAEVFISGDNGATWTSLESWAASSTPNAEFKEYNISAIAAGQSQVLVRWHWTGDYSWYWAVDDVVVFEPSITYSVLFIQDGGNPNGINTVSDTDPVANWDTLVDISQASNIWSSSQAIPFPFEFYGQSVTHLKASLNGLVTFDTTVTGTPPDGNTNLPSSLLPDMTIACMWDNFTLTPPTGTNDRVITRTFGTAPNRQFWIKWFSFEWANISFNYPCVVLEESSNKVYVVDMYSSTTPLLSATVGVQLDNTTATQFSDSNLVQGGNGTSIADNDYYEFFVPSGDDIGVVYAEVNYPGFLLFPNTSTTIRAAVQNLGTSDATNFDVTYMVSDGSSGTETYTNILASGATDTVTFATPWVPADSGDYTITVYTTYPPDGNPTNDTTVVSQVVTYIQILNYQQDFELYTGNPSTIGFYGADNQNFGFFTPSPTNDGSWTTDAFGNDPTISGDAARFNFFSTTIDDKDWHITPPVDMTTSPPGGAPQLVFDISVTPFTGVADTLIPPGDTLFVVASTDGQTWSRSNILDQFTHDDPIPAAGVRMSYDLSAYASATSLYIGFLAMDPPNAEDINVYIDNLFIGVPPTLDVGPTALVTPVPGVFYGANEDVTVKVQNFGPSTIDFSVDPLTVNVDISGASTQNFSVVVNTGTLDPDSSFDVLVTGNADLTAAGTHTFTMNTVIAGDGNPANDVLATDIFSAPILSAFPYFEHFDSTTAGAPGTLPENWQNVPGDDIDWWVEASGTQNSTNTGPLNDNSGTGNYMYVESSSPNFPDIVAHLHSPAFDISGLADPALYFYFHMYGADMGEIHVDAYVNGAWVLDIMPPLVGQYQTAETDPWIRRGVDLSGLGSPVMVRFRGITGAGFTSDMAIDDVTIGEAIPDVATTAVNDPKLTMLSLSQIGLVSAIDIAATFSNNGPANTGDLNTVVYDALMNPVYANTVPGVTLNTFSDSMFTVGTADASGADPGDYTAAIFTSNFNDNFPANDTLYTSLNLGSTMAYDNGVQSTSGTFSSTARSWFAANYTLTDPDTIKSISILVSASALATDSFAVEIWSVVNDEPSTPLVSVYEGVYSELGTLPALVQFDVPGGGYVVAPGTYAMVFDMKNTNSFPCGIDFTAQGAANIPRTFWGKLETTAWLPFETVGAGTWTPIIRAGLGSPAGGPPPVPLPFAESFDDTSMAIPTGWARFELDGGDEVPGVDWLIDDGTGAGYAPQSGAGHAMNWYQAADPNGYIDEWLVTPQLLDYQSGMHLSFYLRHVAGPWNDSLMVMVSTTGMAPGDFTMIDYINSLTDWTPYSYDLGAHGVSAGDDFYIAFRYLHYDGGSFGNHSNLLTVDEVKVDTIPSLAPPTNLTAQGGNGVVNLMWEAPNPVTPGELFYDDGTAEGNISLGDGLEGDLAVRFTPVVYPSTIIQIKVHFAATVDPLALTSVDYTLWDGSSTGPGTALATGNQAINRDMWDLVDVSSHNVQISSGDFFISYHEPSANVMQLSWDTNQPSADRSWVNAPAIGLNWVTSGTVGPTFDNNYMIRAIVQEGTGPNARIVEISPNGERKVLSAAEQKRLAAQNHTLGKNAFSGAVSFNGTQHPQTGGHASHHGGTPSLIEDLTGYNVYRSEDGTNFNFLDNVDAMTTEYSDSAVTNGTDYWYYVTAVYPEGESDPSNTAMATPTAPTEFFDDFEAYAAGVQLVVQNSTDWTTWSNLPGSGEDPFVSDAHSYSGANSVVIVQNNDVVKEFAPAPITSGIWEMSWQMYIPSGGAGYFNTLADFAGANSTWAMQVFFDAGGTGRLDAGGASAATFSYAYDTWMPVVVIVDLGNDLAEFWLNGTMIYSWQYTLGTFGTPLIPLQLDANNFYGATAVDQMYVDDYTVAPYVVGIDDEISALPTEFALEQNFPNPFNPTTTIKYALKENADVTLKIYNVLGQVVKTLVNEKQTAGFKELSWDGTNDFGAKVASGIYIYRIQANDFVHAKKMIMMK